VADGGGSGIAKFRNSANETLYRYLSQTAPGEALMNLYIVIQEIQAVERSKGTNNDPEFR
jgi:hypothetical protein